MLNILMFTKVKLIIQQKKYDVAVCGGGASGIAAAIAAARQGAQTILLEKQVGSIHQNWQKLNINEGS